MPWRAPIFSAVLLIHCTLHTAHCTLKEGRGGEAAIAPKCSAPQGDPSLHTAHCTLFTLDRQKSMRWHPVYTLPRNEKKLLALLEAQGVTAYLPLRRHINVQQVHKNGKTYCYKRPLQVPMFTGYLFACIPYELQSSLRYNRSVINILPTDDDSEELLLKELELIHQIELFAENDEIDVSNGLTSGMRVRFTAGSFLGWDGVVADSPHQDGFVYINVNSVGSSIRLRYPAMWCEKIQGPEVSG